MSTTVSEGWKSIPAMSAAAAERFADGLAIVDGDTTLSHSELFDAARSFAAALVESGIQPGDRVAIWTFNSAEWVIAALGLFQSAATLVPINTRFKGVEAADILRRSGARALVTVTDFLGIDYVAMLRGTGIALPDLETIVVARGEAAGGTLSWKGSSPAHVRIRSQRVTGAALRSAPTIRRTSFSPRGRQERPGCRDDPQPDAARGHRLGRDDRPMRG